MMRLRLLRLLLYGGIVGAIFGVLKGVGFALVNATFIDHLRTIFLLGIYFGAGFFFLGILLTFGIVILVWLGLLLERMFFHRRKMVNKNIESEIEPLRISTSSSENKFNMTSLSRLWYVLLAGVILVSGITYLGLLPEFKLLIPKSTLQLLFIFGLIQIMTAGFIFILIIIKSHSNHGRNFKSIIVLIAILLITIIFGTIIQNRVAIAWQKQQQVINPVETAGVTALVPQNVKTKVILFAWDGACWEIITPLLQQGKLPNLQRLITQGATGRIKSMRPTKSPVIWTVIVTGKPPAQNGVFEFVRIANIPGIPEEFPITTTSELTPIEFRLFPVAEKLGLCSMVQNQQTDRQVKAIWNILSEQKKTVGIINFWNTYPPEPVNGFMIPHFLDIHAHHQGQITYPPSLYAAISASIPQELPITHKQLLRYIPILKNKPALVLPQGKEEQELYQFLVNLGERWDTFVARIGKQLFQQLHPDLLCIYFEGGDMVSHKAWKYYYPEQFWGVSAKEVALFREILPNYYIFLDQQLGEFLNLMDENTVFIVMSDHGFHAIPAWKEFLYSRITGPYISADHYLAPDGIIVVAGKGVKPNSQITSASVFDITPTLLWLFGLPTAEDMTGTVINSVFDEHIYGSIRKIPTYEFTKRNTITSTTRQVLTPEMVEQLKSLGYIGK